LRFGGVATDGAANGTIDREAVVVARCDAPPLYDVCSINGQQIAGTEPIAITLPAAHRFELHEVLPTNDPVPATVMVRLTGAAAALVQVGDQDSLLDSRGARVSAINGRDANGATVTLALGVDESREGWRYRGRLVRPGGTLELATSRYETTSARDFTRHAGSGPVTDPDFDRVVRAFRASLTYRIASNACDRLVNASRESAFLSRVGAMSVSFTALSRDRQLAAAAWTLAAASLAHLAMRVGLPRYATSGLPWWWNVTLALFAVLTAMMARAIVAAWNDSTPARLIAARERH
jgi:hypothetical protein